MGVSLDTLGALVAWLAALHDAFRDDTSARPLKNVEMRRLNHEHIFEVPLRSDDGLDLDAYAVTPVHGWLAGHIAAGRYAAPRLRDLLAHDEVGPGPRRATVAFAHLGGLDRLLGRGDDGTAFALVQRLTEAAMAALGLPVGRREDGGDCDGDQRIHSFPEGRRAPFVISGRGVAGRIERRKEGF